MRQCNLLVVIFIRLVICNLLVVIICFSLVMWYAYELVQFVRRTRLFSSRRCIACNVHSSYQLYACRLHAKLSFRQSFSQSVSGMHMSIVLSTR